jgi:predicted nucleotidyltransferase
MDRTSLERVADEYGVVLLLQFGSTVAGREHARSDVDLAVLLAGAPPSLRTLAALGADLQSLYPGARSQDHRKYLALERDYVVRTLRALASR